MMKKLRSYQVALLVVLLSLTVKVLRADGPEPNLVQDIFPNLQGSFPESLINVNGTLFFSASDEIHGRSLWKSDGTEKGTVLLKDIWPEETQSFIGELTNVNGTLFFVTDDNDYPDPIAKELWKSDGTEAGTVLVHPKRDTSNSKAFQYLTNVNGTLFFTARDDIHRWALWKSDGTEAGTVMVKQISPGVHVSETALLTNVNGTLFFVADDGIHGRELWKSDGTEAGTVMVKDIRPGMTGGLDLREWTGGLVLGFGLTEVNGTLFFTADDGIHGAELWQSDGTEAGTVLVKDIWPVGDGASPAWLTDVNGTLFFSAEDGLHGRELWVSNGTEAGTALVKDIWPGGFGWARSLANVDGTLFFTAFNNTHGEELWQSDGTEVGTVLVKDIRPGESHSRPEYLTNVNGTLFFAADDGTHGRELWQSDGTGAGTVLVKDIRAGGDGASPERLTDVNGTLFFSADDRIHGTELWIIPTLEIDAMPPSKAIKAGEIAVYTLNLNVRGDYSDTATLATLHGLPNIDIDLTPLSIVPPAQAHLTITHTNASFIPSVLYTVPITSVFNEITKTSNLRLLVNGNSIHLPLVTKK